MAPEASAGARLILCLALFLATDSVERDHLDLHNAPRGTVIDSLQLMHQPRLKAALVRILHIGQHVGGMEASPCYPRAADGGCRQRSEQ